MGEGRSGRLFIEADLADADLGGASLWGADLHGVRMMGVRADRDTVWPGGMRRAPVLASD